MIKNYLIISLLCCFFGFSQFNSSAPWMNKVETGRINEANIDEITNSFNQYWSNKDKTKKGSGFKPFMRWENHWRNKVNEQGYLITPQEMWAAWAQKNAGTTNRNSLFSLPTSNWQPIGPFSNAIANSTRARGRVNIVEVDPTNPNIIYFGTPAGGLWKSVNAGASWVPLTDKLPQIGVSGIAVDPTNSNVIYIATGDRDATDTYSIGVMKSIDGGTTWNTTGLTFANTTSRAGDLIMHPSNNQILFCATSVGLQKTSDGGATWTVVKTGNFSQGSVRFKHGNPSVVYAVNNNRFHRSTDTGATFTTITSGLPLASSRLMLDVTPANTEYVYILSATSGGAFQGIYRSINGGTSFTKTSGTTDVFDGSSQSWYDMALAVSDTNANEIYTGCLNIWKSSDGGVTINRLNEWNVFNSKFTHADIHFMQFKNNKLYSGTDGGIYVSADAGSTFNDITGAAQITQFYKISVAKQTASRIAGGTQDNGGYAYDNNLWKGYHGGDGMDCAIDPTNSGKYYGFIYYGQTLYVSNDAGSSLIYGIPAPTSETGTGDNGGNWVTPMIANSQGELFAGFNKLYKLSGVAWTQQSSASIGTGDIDYIAVDPSNDDIMYVSNGNILYKSTNRGLTFSTAYSGASSNITSIDVHSSDSNIVYLTTSGTAGQVLKSINGGTAFSDFSTGLPSIGKNIIVHQGHNTDNPLYVGTSLGVYYRDDSMSSWQPFDTNLPNVSVTDLEINLEDGKLIAGTYGRGIWQTDIPVQVPTNDVKFVKFVNPGINVNCVNTITPEIEVKNNGSNTLSSITINYSVDGIPYTFLWNGTLASTVNTTITLPTLTASRGAHILNIATTTSGDAFGDNNNGSTQFFVNDSGVVGVVNPFTNTSDALISYNEGTSGSQWQRGIRASGILATGSNTVYASNLTGNYPDLTKSYLVSQCYNLSNVVNPEISFKLAFDLETNWDIVYVQYSTDFGANWNVLGSMGSNWYNSNRTQATAGNDCYNCPGAQWTGTNATLATYSYPLNSLNSETNIIFRIVFHSDEGVNQIGANVDDFVINGTLSNENFELQKIKIYPNPSNGVFYISLGDLEPTSIEVYDLTGKIILSKKNISVNNFETSIDLKYATKGIYFVKIIANNQSVVKRIIKE